MKKQFFFVFGKILTAGALLTAAEAPSTKYQLTEPGGGQLSSILASVNAEPICLTDVLPRTRQQEYQAYAGYSGKELYNRIQEIRRRAVEDIINRKLTVADYQEQTFRIPPQALEEEVDNIAERLGCRSRSEFLRQLRENHTTLEKVKKEVEEGMIYQVMLHRQTQIDENVTPREIHEYYQAHNRDLGIAEAMELGLILISKKAGDIKVIAQTIEAELKAEPEKFRDLAARYSIGPEAQNGGSLGWIDRKRLRPEFSAALTGNIQKGIWRGPIETPEGTAFLKIWDYRPAKTANFAEAEEKIRKKLENAQKKQITEEYFKQLRSKALIQYYF